MYCKVWVYNTSRPPESAAPFCYGGNSDRSAGPEPETACWSSVHSVTALRIVTITIRADMGPFLLLFCLIYSHVLVVSSDDIVVACGGFVKSDVEINYSLIEVR